MRRPHGAELAEIEAVYRSRFPVFVRIAAAIVGDADTGRDAVQDAFAQAIRRRGDFRREGTLEGWLWRILVNVARSRRRSDLAAATSWRFDDRTTSWNGGHADPEVAAFRALLAQLPERQRLVVFLRYFADLDHARIAEALDIRPGTVGATLNAAHAALRRRLEEVPR
jgi:RNA polymerase sigma-70 factor (ECF subfamily)